MTKFSLFLFLTLLGLLGSWTPLNSIPAFKNVVLLAGSVLLFFITCLGKLKHTGSKLLKLTPLSLYFLLFLLWSALGFLYSADPEKSLWMTIQSLSAIVLYLGLTLYIEEKNQLENIFRVLLVIGGIIALIGIIQQFPIPLLDNPISRDNNSTSLFAHRNVFSGYLVLLMPLSCLGYFSDSTKLWKYVAGISLILILTAVGFSGSRGGQLVAIFELVAIFGYQILKKNYKATMPLLQGIIISMVLYSIIDLIVKDFDVTPNRTSLPDLITGVEAWGQSLNRVLFWQGALEIFKEHWLIGSGPLSFAILFPKYYIHVTPILNGQTLSSGIPPHAHNLFLQTASDSGLIGIGLLLTFLTFFYLRTYKLFINSDLKIQPTIFYIALAVTSFLLHGLVEYNWPSSMFIYHFTIFIFTISFIEKNKFPQEVINASTGFINNAPALGTLFVFLTLIPTIQFYKYENFHNKSLFKEINFAEFQSLMMQAKQICPRCDRTHMKIAKKLLTRHRANPDNNILNAAKNELIEGRKLNPYNPHYMGYLGQILAIQGDYDQALELIKEAAKYNRTHHITKLGLSRVQLLGIDRAKSNIR